MTDLLKSAVAICLTVALCPVLKAQQTFDSKKHARVHVNTAPLNARAINGSSRSAAARSATKSYRQHQQPFATPLLQQRRMEIEYAPATGLPSFIRSPRRANSGRMGLQRDTRTATFDYLDELKDVLKISKPDDAFMIRSSRIGRDNRTHVRMSQLYKGVPVYGSEVIVHLDQSGDGAGFNGHYRLIREDIDVTPVLPASAAIQRVNAHLGTATRVRQLSAFERELVLHEQPQATLCIYQDKGLVRSDVLAYHITSCPSVSERWEYFVDATTGAILHQYANICAADGPRIATGTDLNGNARTIQTYQSGTSYVLLDISRPMYKVAQSSLPDNPVGGIVTIDMNNTFGEDRSIRHVVSTNNQWTSNTGVKALSAHFNAGLAYEYFRTTHNRNSIDGAGGTIISIVNVPDDDGTALDNAYWNGKAMFYGNGDVGFKPLAGGIDVAGHEMTHGVVQNTANLEYQGESGAINESMADVFGSMIDPDGDWLIGEDVVKTTMFPSGAMRSLSDPHNGGTSLANRGYQPKHVDEQYTGTQDNGGVHINSGIPNHAFYKYATAITRAKAAAVYYKALDDYLTKSSQFIDLRLAVVQAATDLFGAGSTEAVQAGIAFDAVGISNGEGGDYEESLPVNPGAEFLLVYNTSQSDPNTLYRAPVNSGSINGLTTTGMLSRPSVTDQGDVAVFVADDHTIHAIKTMPGSLATETVIQDEEIWSNVVVSKGGSKLAAVTMDQDARIYVYDFASQEWAWFELYNPTYTEGVISAGPVYADALEWDYTGEFLVYDCFNRIDNATGADIEYWDVNFIHVWDNAARTFGDGTIQKLFSSLPPGVSVGNPSFAKNSPAILAFDYMDESDDTYAILGCNIETNDLNVIVENNSLGWPSYNKADDRLAFTGWNDAEAAYSTGYIMLNPDKISAGGNVFGLYSFTMWPVYFAVGAREIGDEVITDVPDQQPVKEAPLSCYPNTFDRELMIAINDPSLSGGSVQLVNAAGQAVFMSATDRYEGSQIVLNLEHLRSGYYFLRVTNASRSAGCKIVKR